jgi:hypothetical protein
MAEYGIGATGEDRGHLTLARGRYGANAVYAAVDRLDPALLQIVVDPVLRYSFPLELPSGNHPMLSGGKR